MSNSEDFAVRVTLSPEQARAVVRALDVYLRIHIGQFNIILEQFYGKDFDRDEIEGLLFEARDKLFPGLHGRGHSLSASACPEKSAKIGYDVLQAIRQKEAFGRHPEGGMTVNFDDPHWISDSIPRPKAEILGLLDRLADV